MNSPKRPPYWNYTSVFDFDHITAVDMSFCTSLRNFIQIGPTSAEKNDVVLIFKMADLSHPGFYGSNNGFFEEPNYITSCRSSSDASLPIFPKIALIALWKDRLAWVVELLNVRPPTIYVPRYRNSVTHGIIWPLDVLMLLRLTSHRGPMRIQQDFFHLCSCPTS